MLLVRFLGGLALLLGGVGLLGSGIETWCAGSGRLPLRTRLQGVLLGVGVTGIVQSSSAVTVGVCALTGGGAVPFPVAAGLLYGANLGTTGTAWLVALGLQDTVWLPAAVAVAALLPRRKALRHALLGLTVLLVGLSWMTDAAAPLARFAAPVLARCRGPVSGFFLGLLTAAAMQTSSGAIALVQALPLPDGAALGMVLGCNVGTCATALLATVRQPPQARAAARLHLCFNLLGLVPGALLLPCFTAAQIPLYHTLVNAVTIGLALPLSLYLEKFSAMPRFDGLCRRCPVK